MSFMQHEASLIKALRDSDYAMFDGNKDEAFDFMQERYRTFVDYANSVITQQYTLPIIYARYEGDELRDRVERLDRTRRSNHNVAIDSVNMLNRISKKLGIQPFAEIDTGDRYAVADCVGNFVNEMYQNGQQGKGMGGAALNRSQPYDHTTLHTRLRQAEALSEGIGAPDYQPEL